MTSRVFKIDNGNDGLLPPTKTTAEKNALPAPTAGTMLYDTDVSSTYQYKTQNMAYYSRAYITNLQLTSNVVTVTVANSMTAGDTGFLENVIHASWSALLNGYTFTALTANATTVTFARVNADIGSTAITTGTSTMNYIIPYTATIGWYPLLQGNYKEIFLFDFITLTGVFTISSGSLVLEVGSQFYNSGSIASPGTYITLTIPTSVSTGIYLLNWGLLKTSSLGNFTITFNIGGGAFTTIADNINGYSGAGNAPAFIRQHYFIVPSAGAMTIRWTTNSKYVSSTAYNFVISQVVQLIQIA